MDAARAPGVIEAIPADRVGAVAGELARRGEWVVIGGFVDQVSPRALAAAVDQFTGEQLLRIAFVLDVPERLDTVAELLADAQVDDLLASAVRLELWEEFDELVRHLSPERVERLRDRLAAAPEDVRAAVGPHLPSSRP
jgi:hypothetical protein